ncbi:cytochrome d ubiquinol oxidase subunit II [Dermatobacter hominis]|uniref:cytochrome d ubiquinol oxidase subunit II n=1 Tax=Dermatobacter hominis TaxID=2884263 RepID=UPI001D1187B5|nr:cytochrome d ubiquinol oxidase subunit II [Dermatobacter hominis]UDY34298.1 cytochrome d ubiquinol oxidase subunit II [Dermatobacter hominis]
MWLNTLWFVLFVMIIAGYVVLDGFDLGVGMLSPVLARDDRDHRLLLNSIGPVWDGNEVWLVLGGGALFAAFPIVYASLFSGFYLAMMLVLLVLILRTIAIEFRSQRESPRWRATWDWFFFASSLGITLLLGVALGNVIRGVAIDAAGEIDVDLVEMLNPYSLAVGVTAVAMLCLHGCLFVTLKVDGPLLERAERLAPKLMVGFFVLMTVLIAWTLMLDNEISDRYADRLWIGVFPLLALVATLVSWRQLRRRTYFTAFLASGVTIALLLATVAAGVYPVLLTSSIDPSYDLTIHNAASAEPTLMVMFVIALIGIPFVLLYTAGVYYFFRGRVVLHDESY